MFQLAGLGSSECVILMTNQVFCCDRRALEGQGPFKTELSSGGDNSYGTVIQISLHMSENNTFYTSEQTDLNGDSTSGHVEPLLHVILLSMLYSLPHPLPCRVPFDICSQTHISRYKCTPLYTHPHRTPHTAVYLVSFKTAC